MPKVRRGDTSALGSLNQHQAAPSGLIQLFGGFNDPIDALFLNELIKGID